MNTLIKTSLGLAALLMTMPAQAQEFKPAFAPYVGLDLVHYNASYNDNYDAGGGIFLDGDALLEDGLNGLNIHVGNRFSKHFGAELGYFRTRDEDRDIAAGAAVGPGVVAAVPFQTKTQLQGITLDALGYLPVGPEDRFELIGTAGLSWTKGEVELNVPGAGGDSVNESELGFRIGGGAQFNITDQVNVRGLVRYNTADFDNIADRAWVYSAGLNFSF